VSAGWRYRLTPGARRDLKRLDPPVRRRLIAALDYLVEGEELSGDIRKLRPGEWRMRVGDWRVRIDRDDDARAIVVLRVLPRGRAYDR
jgi:mRNA interferase RelE/StbE